MPDRVQLTGSVAPHVPTLAIAETRYCFPVKLSVKVTFAVSGPLLVTVATNFNLPPNAAGSGACVRVTEISAAGSTTMLADAVFPVPFTIRVQLLLVAMPAPVSDTLPEPATAVAVPPQLLTNPLGVATTIPAGKVSVNATPLRGARLIPGLVMVKVSEVVPLNGTLVAPKALAIDGGPNTVRFAVAVPPVMPTKVPLPSSNVPVMVLVVLTLLPAVVPVTLMEKEHEPFARVNEDKLMLPVPEVAEATPGFNTGPAAARQVPAKPLGVAMTSPAGRLSVNPRLSRFAPLGLLMVKVRLVLAPMATVAAPKALARVGGMSTFRLSVAVAPGPLSLEEMAPVVFTFRPGVVPRTKTVMSQVVLAPARETPDKLTEPDPATAVNVPPQLLTTPGGVLTTSPAGKLSLTAMPVSTKAFELPMVKVMLVLPLRAILCTPKNLVMLGSAATLRLALAVLPVPPLLELTGPVVLVYMPETAPVTVTLNTHWLFTATLAPLRTIPVGAVVVRVPPQVLDELLATVSPAGRVSLNPTPVRAAVLAAGFVMVKVSDVVAFNPIAAGLKALAIEGAATTVRTAVLLVAPVPPSVEVTALVVLLLLPAVVPVTFTENVHDDPAAGDAVSVPPAKLIVPLPAVAVIVPLPQEPVRFGVAATTTPAGKLSLKPTPLSALAVFGLVMVKLSVLLELNGTLVGLNALLMVGGATTVIEALAVLPVPPSVEVTCTLLFFTPAVVPVTLTENVHDDPAPGDAVNVPPARLTVPLPAAAVIVPLPQDPVRLGVAATTRPAGSTSLNATPLSATLVFGL